MKYLFISDMHIRADIPRCRLDDFQIVQEKTLYLIRDIALKHNAIIIIAGDVFHRSRPLDSQYLEVLLHDIFDGITVIFIVGQHDLKDHSMANFNRGSIGVLSKFNHWQHLNMEFIENVTFSGFNWNDEIKQGDNTSDFNIAVLHKFVSDEKLPPWLEEKGITAKDLCKKYNYNIFVTGDNHKSFVYEDKKTGQIVFNCGTITRQKANEKDYKPAVYLYDSAEHDYVKIDLIDNDPKVITNITTSKLDLERETRIDSFVKLVSSDKNLDFDFEANLKMHCEKNKIKQGVINKINEIVRECL